MASFIDECDVNSQLLTCPVNRLHKVKRSQYTLHAEKCRKECGRTLSTCPFNAEHFMEWNVLDEHKLECPNNKNVIIRKYETQTFGKPRYDRTRFNETQCNPKDDQSDWNATVNIHLMAEKIGENNALRKSGITAQELINRFNDNDVISHVETSRLSKAEKKKFRTMLIERAKDKAKRNEDANNNLSNESTNYGRIVSVKREKEIIKEPSKWINTISKSVASHTSTSHESWDESQPKQSDSSTVFTGESNDMSRVPFRRIGFGRGTFNYCGK